MLFTVFLTGSAGILAISWRSLRNPRLHGFYRFFAFECLLGLVLVGARTWFVDPLSARQILSWVLLAASFLLAVHGFYLLWRFGEPKGGLEKTVRLVTRGAYRHIRHPLYASLLAFGWGAFLKGPSPLTGVLALASSALLAATAKAEEKESLEKFGDEYRSYMETTRMFVPHLI